MKKEMKIKGKAYLIEFKDSVLFDEKMVPSKDGFRLVAQNLLTGYSKVISNPISDKEIKILLDETKFNEFVNSRVEGQFNII